MNGAENTHAELIRDLADIALRRHFGRPSYGPGHRARIAAGVAARAFGNHALAQSEDWADAERECAAAMRMALSIRAGWVERGIATI